MKHVIDNKSGILVLIPETEGDRLLLFHLMNCGNMTRFTQYLETDVTEGMTEDLGIEYHEFNGYLTACEPVPFRPVEVAAQNSTETETGRLIGFNRNR